MESATSISAPRGKTKARKRTSWTEKHMISIKDGDAYKLRCAYCHLLWASSTSIGSIAKHLSDKPNINSTSQPQTSDGASESLVASKELARLLLSHHGQDILQSSHMLRCMVHTYQLGVKSALEVITPSTMKLRKTLHSIRTSKVSRELYSKNI